ncbi:MAG: hypothetical protein AB8C95_12955 [Phycisphaeraceae bacterium]
MSQNTSRPRDGDDVQSGGPQPHGCLDQEGRNRALPTPFLFFSAGNDASRITLPDLPGDFATTYDALFGVHTNGNASLSGNIRLNLTVPDPASGPLPLAAAATPLCRRRPVVI